MQYITPTGKIGLIQNAYYKADLNYNHTGLFSSRAKQTEYFNSVSVKYSNYTYNKERNKFIIGDNVKNISNYTYMYFNNVGSSESAEIFENKRYYAFITDVKYINNNTTEISFKIDVIQTFLYDIKVSPCLVEREHTITDNLYEHIIPEDIAVDDVITAKETEINYSRMLCGVILNKKIPTNDNNLIYLGKIKHDGALIDAYQKFIPYYSPISSDDNDTLNNDVCGVANTLYWYTGFPVSLDDIIGFRAQETDYYLQGLRYYTAEGVELPVSWYNNASFTVGVFLDRLVRGVYEGLSEDNIVSVYMYPAYGSERIGISVGKQLGYNDGVAVKTFEAPKSLMFRDIQEDVYFSPKNNKLYIYPYSYIECINNQGESSTYKYENFKGDDLPTFQVCTNNSNPSAIILIPEYYNGDRLCYDEMLSYTGFPEPYYKGDSLNRYLQQNEAKRNASIISSALSFGVSGLASGLSKNPLPAVSGASGFIGSALTHHAQIVDIKNTPPKNYTSFNSDYLNISIGKVGFVLKNKQIKVQLAKIIDNYFTVNGYKISEIKIPNVFEYIEDNSVKIRPNFNFIKTNNALVSSVLTTAEMCDSTVLNEFASILNNGITFWSNIAKIGDYSLDNQPVQ